MASVRIYHNPRCSKSRQTLALLTEKGHEPEIVDYLKTPMTTQEIANLMTLLGFEDPRKMMRVKEAEYKDNGLDDKTIGKQQLIDAMARIPKLIERPIVVANNKARLGRPPEAVLEIL